MKNRKWLLLFCIVASSFFYLVSCNTTGVSPTNYSRIKVINAISGSSPFNFYLNGTIATTATVTYPAASGYVTAVPGAKALKTSFATTPTLYFYSKNVTLALDSSYSIFINSPQDGVYSSLVTKDTLFTPSQGKAKIRYVNVSNSAGATDVTINGTAGFPNIAYNGLAKFIEVPAGTYEFKAFKHSSTDALFTLSNQVLTDGTVYTLYSAGTIGATATNALYQLVLTSNLLPATK